MTICGCTTAKPCDHHAHLFPHRDDSTAPASAGDAPRCPFCGEAITGQPLEHLVDCGPSLEWLGDPPVSPTDSGPEKVEAWLRERYVRAPSHTACVKHVRSLLAEVARLQERVTKLEGALRDVDGLIRVNRHGMVEGPPIEAAVKRVVGAALSTTEGEGEP